MKTVLIIRNKRLPMLDLLSMIIAVFLILPVLAIGLTALEDNRGLFSHLVATVLPGYVMNTLMLMTGVGVMALIFGIGTAWIISRYEFPLKRLLEWMLVMPAAVPAYLVAYTYTDFFEYAGPVQTMLRDAMGWQTSRDYWFPEIRSMGGAIVVMSSVLYPYIYITARTGFGLTSTRLFEAAIITGRQNLLSIALPLARPAIMAGLALVLMEVVSDFGTVEYFAVDTITLGIFNVWLGMNNMPLAAQLSLLSFSLIILLLWLERASQVHRRVQNASRGASGVPLHRVRGIGSVVLPLICLVPILLGFGIPSGVLLNFIIQDLGEAMPPGSIMAFQNTFNVALTASVIIMMVASFLGVMSAYRLKKQGKAMVALSAVGYAFPGTILAIGVLTVSGYGDAVLRWIVPDTSAIITGSMVMLLLGYVIRFQAVGYGTVRSGLKRLPPNLMSASLVMGHRFGKSIRKVILPLMKPSLLAGLLIAFVDIMKELPMTLLLRPFNFETLATVTYQFAKEEMLEAAALPATVIVIAGLVPVVIINRSLGQSNSATPRLR